MAKRKYTLQRRAEQQEETRARIVDAAMTLHEELGPAKTTISAIADRAGVERLTVYRHFPDNGTIFRACSSRYLDLNPPPDPSGWQEIRDPAERTRTALAAMYGYYHRTEAMWSRVFRDRGEVPALEMVMVDFDAFVDGLRMALAGPWKSPPSTRKHLNAILGHALHFQTWQSLHDAGLSDDAMADAMVRWVEAMRSPRRGNRRR